MKAGLNDAPPKFGRVLLCTTAPPVIALAAIFYFPDAMAGSTTVRYAVGSICFILLLPLLPAVLIGLLIMVAMQACGIPLPSVNDTRALVLFAIAIPVSAFLNFRLLWSIHRRK